MAKLQDCQFIEIKIDGKVVSGSSEETNYKNWMEGYAPAGLATIAGPDGIYFDSVHISILATKQTSELYEKYLNRGYKNITITIVHRGSDKLNQNYEIQRTVYDSCNFQSLNFEMRDKFFIDLTFTFEESVQVTFNVPNTKDDGLDKVGPTKYSIPQKKII
ncbi:hypothetical protein BL250_14420 [Erwinia sp. OLTSP20]|uniref:hypothetical protein n=1 Tax=unclassified Erwinia TaxID=2622719 RepID=UPI000C17EF9A|nr:MULTISPECIES: hypothetical protein [unclassified Erwinia]PIJ48242.1 hypothetical protein BV501_17810 [Erwinia sp. OAMSP11]PIJ68742.1 hypothetical protein BK416_16100 [Erwinia sp. OLSSP12]PIJ78917.1 hypothetical protein BLD47_16015 [Erwinia sp. OLCASP19]PIJ79527.1 hypothetical protein BLD46_16810 [Erwinia sp. OLMTSP26]PIJ81485.1 hypothetical protein BLD49_16420 [Erwinia sp. OLMDSP33]